MIDITVRDLTTNKDLYLVLPKSDTELKKKILDNHEYIVIDYDSRLQISEYTNITELNQFLLDCEENGIDKETLSILAGVCCDWKDVKELIDNESYTIWDTSEIDKWAVSGDEALGLFMYEQGYNTLPCEVPEDLVDYINWEQNWFALETMGWTKVRYNGTDYVVHR